VDDPVGANPLDDLVGAVAVVLVEVEDADPTGAPFLLQYAGRDHQAVEGAEARGAVVAGVVEATRCGASVPTCRSMRCARSSRPARRRSATWGWRRCWSLSSRDGEGY